MTIFILHQDLLSFLPLAAKAMVIRSLTKDFKISQAEILTIIEDTYPLLRGIDPQDISDLIVSLLSPMTCSAEFERIISESSPEMMIANLRASGFEESSVDPITWSVVWFKYCKNPLLLRASPLPCFFDHEAISWSIAHHWIRVNLEERLENL